MQSAFDDQFKVSEIDLIYHSQPDITERPKVISSKDAYLIFRQVWDVNKIDLLEQSKVMMLDRNNHVLGIYNASSGGITGTVMDARLIYTAALKANASSLVLAHNHPSGSLTPSNADKQVTARMKEAGKMLGISVLDHLIVTRSSYYSFADDEGIPFVETVTSYNP